jgi:hypothetical protein
LLEADEGGKIRLLSRHVSESLMSPAQILAEVRRTPFEPFRMVLGNGAVYNIRHPDQCMVLPKSVVVGEVSPADDGFIEWTVTVNPWNVLRIEHEHSHELAGAAS